MKQCFTSKYKPLMFVDNCPLVLHNVWGFLSSDTKSSKRNRRPPFSQWHMLTSGTVYLFILTSLIYIFNLMHLDDIWKHWPWVSCFQLRHVNAKPQQLNGNTLSKVLQCVFTLKSSNNNYGTSKRQLLQNVSFYDMPILYCISWTFFTESVELHLKECLDKKENITLLRLT